MATIKISDLPEGSSTLSANDMFPIVDAGTNTTKKITLQNLENYIQTDVPGLEDKADLSGATFTGTVSFTNNSIVRFDSAATTPAIDVYSTFPGELRYTGVTRMQWSDEQVIVKGGLEIVDGVDRLGLTVPGEIDMNFKHITNLASPTTGFHAVNRNYVATEVATINARIDSVEAYDEYSTTSTVLNTNEDVYNNNGLGGATRRATDDPNGEGGWYFRSPGDSGGNDHYIGWRMFNNDGPQTFTVEDIQYMYMVAEIYADGQFYFNLYTAGLNPAPSAFRSRFTFNPSGGDWNGQTGLYLIWAKPPGSTTTDSDVDVYPFLPRIEMPYNASSSSGDLNTSEVIKSLNIITNTSAGAGDVEFSVKNAGYKIESGYIQNFDFICAPDDKIANFDASQFDFTNLPTAPTTTGMLYRDSDVIKVTL